MIHDLPSRRRVNWAGVDSLTDIPDLIGAAFSVDGLLLWKPFSPRFFRLKSGVAGELFQKLVNYRITTALVCRFRGPR